jgi:type II secretory pathway component GspD/PulD (secretin)
MEFKSSIFTGVALAAILFGTVPVNSQTAVAVNDGLTRARQVQVRGEAPAVGREQQVRRPLNFCDASFVGEPLSFASATSLTLDDLLDQIHRRFGVNFIVGNKVGEIPINIKSGSVPWNVLLNSQLFVSGIRARCIDDSLVQLVLNSELPKLQETAEVSTRFIKLKFLQPFESRIVDLAGRAGSGGEQGGGGGSSSGSSSGGQNGEQQSSFDKLVCQLQGILGIKGQKCDSAGGQSGSADEKRTEAVKTNRALSQIPGRNILVVTATEEEHLLIDQIVERADRPPFQVVIKGLVYTANESKIKDIGFNNSLLVTTGTGNPIFGTTTNTSTAADSAVQEGSVFDFSAILGTAEFSIQASALERDGVIRIDSRPFALVLDGMPAFLNVGRNIPIVTQSTIGAPGQVTIIKASNILKVTPFVVDDENGNAKSVSLALQLEANEPDSGLSGAVNVKSIQTSLLLDQEKTVILGGFTVDSNSDATSKTPGLGDIPILGYLFKRKTKREELNRLYFAISVSVIPYGTVVQPVDVPNASTDIPAPKTKR